jgi:hypothetical protein
MDAKGGRKKLALVGRVLSLAKANKKAGNCLGADDGAGVWLMREMIAAEIWRAAIMAARIQGRADLDLRQPPA